MEALPVKTSRDVITLINTITDFVIINIVPVTFDSDTRNNINYYAGKRMF